MLDASMLILHFPASRTLKNKYLEINSEYSLGGLLLKLKLQFFDHLMQRADLTGKDPAAGKD